MSGKSDNPNKKRANAHASGGLLGILFLSIIFLIRSGFNFFVYLGLKDLYYGEWKHQAFSALFLLISFLYLASAVGLLARKLFAYYLSWLVVLPDILLFSEYLIYPAYAILGIPLTLLSIYTLVRTREHLEPWDKTDKKAAVVICLIILAYIAFNVWAFNQPKPEEYQKIVTQEAIEKNDVKICDKIVVGRDYCIMDFAQNKRDYKICEAISSEYDKESCYLFIANSLNDPEICGLIKNEYQRGMCDANKTK
ncbi:MAG: hypothetical protein WAX07_06895 [Candidatus Altiarchaeia archaeon]